MIEINSKNKHKIEKCIGNEDFGVLKSPKRKVIKMDNDMGHGIGEQKNLWTRYDKMRKNYNKILATIELKENLNPFGGS